MGIKAVTKLPIDIYFTKVQISVHLQVNNISKMAKIYLPVFKEGMAVEAQFKATGSMDFQKKDYRNIILHVKVDSDRVVMNTKIDGVWGNEEDLNSSGIGSDGKLIKIRVEARPTRFFITINDIYNYGYRHRYHLYTDVNVCMVSTTDLKYYKVFF